MSRLGGVAPVGQRVSARRRLQCAGTVVANATRMRSLCLVLLAACASTDAPPIPLIEHGVYGRIITVCDAEPCDNAPRPDEPVTAYTSGTLAATTTSDEEGNYALELPAGTFVVCTANADPSTLADQHLRNCAGNCTQVDVADAPVEANWGWNLSGGLWDAGNYCP